MKPSTWIYWFLMLPIISFNGEAQNRVTPNEVNDSAKYTGPIIDMHIHAFDENSSFSRMLGQEMGLAMTGKAYKASSSMEKLKEETFAKFEEYNIVKAMVSQGELWYDYAPEKIVIGNNHFLSIDELRKKYKEGKLDVLGEVAPSYQGLLPTDKSLEKYFDLAEELGIPFAYHMFPGGPPGSAYFMYPNIRAFQGKPLQLEEILLSHPKMKIYLMHAGWPYLEDMKALLYAHPQVYVGLGVIDWVLPEKEFHHFLKGLVNAGFGSRIMFGTDQMIWVETIDDAIAAVNSAIFLSMEQKEDIFYNNAARFLGLSEEEIKKHKGQKNQTIAE
ncbi:amidohydrolase family protein [Flavobacteriaceae bacterium F89]|uniref:Amidohydrolase family protein n=1 Tax=Cerina litoralis TaxID=2874477 RepID=A0AAE3ER36_9FLAO|nr:amidohydrolase family protein [Cerina litoralis]MCG2459575.1 amidohydrolase family protein [Cerina litoralis]